MQSGINQTKFRRHSQPLLTLKQVSKTFDKGFPALQNINFCVMPGEIVYISGDSGAGKTTLLEICSLLETPSAGEVEFNGQVINDLSLRSRTLMRRSISFVSQQPMFLRHQTVYQNLALPLFVAGIENQEIQRRVMDMLTRIHLQNYADALPDHLSSGEQGCLNIARALLTHPLLVVADEPIRHGDFKMHQLIMDLLLQANKFGMTLLIATHDLAQIARSKTRALFLRDGQLLNEEVVA